MKTWLIIAVIHNFGSCELEIGPKKNSGLSEIRTHDPCNTSAVLDYQLSLDPFLEAPKNFSHSESCSRVSDLLITVLFYSCILEHEHEQSLPSYKNFQANALYTSLVLGTD